MIYPRRGGGGSHLRCRVESARDCGCNRKKGGLLKSRPTAGDIAARLACQGHSNRRIGDIASGVLVGRSRRGDAHVSGARTALATGALVWMGQAPTEAIVFGGVE